MLQDPVISVRLGVGSVLRDAGLLQDVLFEGTQQLLPWSNEMERPLTALSFLHTDVGVAAALRLFSNSLGHRNNLDVRMNSC